MSLQLFDSIATFATFIVIAATAVAAIFQLRHSRGGNQIAALTVLRNAYQSPEFSNARRFVVTKLEEQSHNPEFRYQWANYSARTGEFNDPIDCVRLVGNYFEDMGAFVAAGLLDSNLVNMIYAADLTECWSKMQTLVTMTRRKIPIAWEYFEYAAMLAERWIIEHAEGSYPANAPRFVITDDWLESDLQYAASRKSP